MKAVSFLGYSNSGKTTAIEHLIRGMVGLGVRVGAMKSIHEEEFTADVPGKDSWRYTVAGAAVKLVVSPHELMVAERIATRDIPLAQLMGIFEGKGIDYLLIEGFYAKLGEEKELPADLRYVLCARTKKEAIALTRQHKHGVVCICGPVTRGNQRSINGVPLVRLPGQTRWLLRALGAEPLNTAAGIARVMS